MKLLCYFSFLMLASCGIKHSSLDYGKTTMSDLVSVRGEPSEEKSIPMDGGKIVHYEDNEKFQVKNEIVTHGFKDPKGDEKNLIFWKHKFKDCQTSNTKISTPIGHELAEYEFKCPALGITVIYSEGSDFISRIVEHEKN